MLSMLSRCCTYIMVRNGCNQCGLNLSITWSYSSKHANSKLAIQCSMNRIVFELILSDLILSDLILSDLILSDLILSDLILSDLILSDLILSELILSDLILSDLIPQSYRNLSKSKFVFFLIRISAAVAIKNNNLIQITVQHSRSVRST